jgi:predicted Zn finger-like uncharacterized protein
MKLRCEECGTKYAISDDKLRGKGRKFKIKCKNCGTMIAIQGLASQTEQEALAIQWYYAIDGKQSGPFSLLQLQEEADTGNISGDSYVWCAGMDDWKLAKELPQTAELFAQDSKVSEADMTMSDELLDEIINEAQLPQQDESELQEEFADYSSEDQNSDTSVEDEEAHLDDQDGEAAVTDATQEEEATEEESETADDAQDDELTQHDFDLASVMKEDNSEPELEPTPMGGSDIDAEPTDEASVPFETGDEAPAAENEKTSDDGEDLAPSDDGEFFDDSGNDVVSSADDLDELAANPDGDNADGEMVYKRSDNSVLFSLSDLDDEPPDPHQEATAKALAAITADSGLIDIRSFTKKKQQKEKPRDLFASLSGDESEAGADGESSELNLSPGAAAIPVIQTKKRTGLYITLGVLGAAALVVGTTLVVINYMQTKGAGKSDVQADTPNKTPAAVKAAAGKKSVGPASNKEVAAVAVIENKNEGKPEAEAATSEEADGSKPAEDGTEKAPEAENAESEAKSEEPKRPLTAAEKRSEKRRQKRIKERRNRRKGAKKAKKETKTVESIVKAPVPPKRKTARLDPNALLSQVQRPKTKKKAVESDAGDPNLPLSLTPTQIRRVVRRAAGKIRKCVTNVGMSNVQVTTSFTILPNGNVSAVRVKGPVAASAAAGCVKGAIARLRFPRFRGPKKNINYPFFVK